MAEPWPGRGPRCCAAGDGQPWRSHGDTVERLELLARALVAGELAPAPGWRATARRARRDRRRDPAPPSRPAARPRSPACWRRSTAASSRPGPSGAPTRGRPDVLPTGRNFYSVDTRTVPTPAAWQLGWNSAALLIERHAQEHGDWPRRGRALGLGHRQHAHRRRRHRPGAGPDRRAADLGRRLAPGHRLRDPAASTCSTGRGST